jgi:hypothetical protein
VVRRLLVAGGLLAGLALLAGCGGFKIPDLIPCPAGQVGKFPNCHLPPPPAPCPAGTHGTPPLCEPDPPPVKVCPAGTHGTPPDCVKDEPPPPPPADKCPAGTHGTPPSCIADAPPAIDLGTDNPEPATLVGGQLAEDGAKPYTEFAADIDRAIDVACARCENGSTVADWVAFVKAVRDTIRSNYGYSAAYDWQHGDPDPALADRLPAGTKGLGSELSIWKNQHYESYQVVTSQRKVRRPPGAFRSRASIAGLCPLKLPKDGYVVELRVGPHGTTGQQFDGTPYVKDVGGDQFPPRFWTGACRPHQCDISPEKDKANGEGCTVDLCGPFLDYRIEPAGSAFINWRDGYTVKITPEGHGNLIARCPVGGAEGSIAF